MEISHKITLGNYGFKPIFCEVTCKLAPANTVTELLVSRIFTVTELLVSRILL